jgi:hypothetical protein
MIQIPGNKKQQYNRIGEIAALGRQRYLDAGGDPCRCPSGRHGNDYLTHEERQELFRLVRQVFGIRVEKNDVYCQGRSWKLSDRKSNPKINRSV